LKFEGNNIKNSLKNLSFREPDYFWYESIIQKPFLLFPNSTFKPRGTQSTMRNNKSDFTQNTLCKKMTCSTFQAKRMAMTPNAIVKNILTWVAYGN
jgi:hypothetical protein